jgi:hypothetical protein
MTDYRKVAEALAGVVETIYYIVKSTPEGVPSGPIYAALMHYGIKLDTYNLIIDGMVKSGKIRKQGHLLFACP